MVAQLPVGFALHDAARLMRKRFEQRARHSGLTRSQWQVLVMLSVNEGIHQKGLADLLEIEPITLVRLLDKMEARGLVERRRHSTDRRMSLLFLTAQAYPQLKIMRGLGDLTRDEAMVNFTEQERAQLLTLLARMKENLIEACCSPLDDQPEHFVTRSESPVQT